MTPRDAARGRSPLTIVRFHERARLHALVLALCALALAGCDAVVRELIEQALDRDAGPAPAPAPTPAPLEPALPPAPDPIDLPADPPGPPPGVYSTLESRDGVTCSLRADGAIICWRLDETVPSAEGTFMAMGTGLAIVCGVRADGAIVCPQGNVAGFDLPAAIAEIPADGPFTQVAGSRGFLCGLRVDGRISCRGRARAAVPRAPRGTFRQVVAGGFFVCGLAADGSATCESALGPPPALRGGPFVQLAAGSDDLCGITAAGELRCKDPVQGGPPPGRHVRTIGFASCCNTCVVLDDGAVACWGSEAAAALARPGPFRAVAPDTASTCALRDSGTVECWRGPQETVATSQSGPLEVEVTGIEVNPNRRLPDVRGVGIEVVYQLKAAAADEAVQFHVRLSDARGQRLRATIEETFTTDGGFVRPQPITPSYGQAASSTAHFVPYFLIDLPPGENQVKVTVEGADRVARGGGAPPPGPVKLSGVLEQTATIVKPPFRMVRLAVASVQVEPGGYDAALFRPRKAMPDLTWEARFGPRFMGRVYASRARDDTCAAAWDRGPAPFPFSEGDVLTLSVYDQDVASDDLLAEIPFTEDQLRAQARQNTPLARGKVLQLVLGLVDVR